MTPPLASTDAGAVDLSVVIVNWNGRAILLDCLRSLLDHPPTRPWEAIVVDNGSVDGSVAALADETPWVRMIANRTNRGLAAANNQGLLAARGDLLLVCNPDTLFQAGAVDAMVAALGRHDRAAIVVPRLLYEDGELQPSAGDLPSLGQALFGRQLDRRRNQTATSGLWWEGWDHDEERAIGRGHEAAYLLRRRAVEEVGLQDERFVLDWEGFDWTARFREAGWEVWLAPEARVVHLGGASIRQVPYRWVASQHRGMYRYFAKRSPAWARPALAATFTVRAGAKMATLAAGVPMYERAHRDRRDAAADAR